jgi:hypothetical protein
MNQLISYLTEAAVDPQFFASFHLNPKGHLASAQLGDGDIAAILSADSEQLNALVSQSLPASFVRAIKGNCFCTDPGPDPDPDPDPYPEH